MNSQFLNTQDFKGQIRIKFMFTSEKINFFTGFNFTENKGI